MHSIVHSYYIVAAPWVAIRPDEVNGMDEGLSMLNQRSVFENLLKVYYACLYLVEGVHGG